MLIREVPATELTVATRILAFRGVLAPDGRVAMLVGSEVVYLAGRGVSAATMTPYDVCAVRVGDATPLAGVPPEDTTRYLTALRLPGMRAVAVTIDGDEVATDLASLVARASGISWEDALSEARAAGALIGAYPGEV